jgi:hypothetical protein
VHRVPLQLEAVAALVRSGSDRVARYVRRIVPSRNIDADLAARSGRSSERTRASRTGVRGGRNRLATPVLPAKGDVDVVVAEGVSRPPRQANIDAEICTDQTPRRELSVEISPNCSPEKGPVSSCIRGASAQRDGTRPATRPAPRMSTRSLFMSYPFLCFVPNGICRRGLRSKRNRRFERHWATLYSAHTSTPSELRALTSGDPVFLTPSTGAAERRRRGGACAGERRPLSSEVGTPHFYVARHKRTSASTIRSHDRPGRLREWRQGLQFTGALT